MKEYIQVLKNRNFALLWAGQGVSNLGSRVSMLALTWLVVDITGRAAAVGMLFIFLTIPSVALGPWAGVLVDRWNKKMIIITADIIAGLLALAMAFTRDISLLYVLALAMSVVSVFFTPAVRTVIPRLVPRERLLTANALSSATFYTAQLAGPALGGVLLGFWGLEAAFIVNAVSFWLSAFSELWIQIPGTETERQSRERSFTADFRDGWQYIRGNLPVKFVIGLFALAMLPPMGGLSTLNVVLIKEVFLFSEWQYGLLMTINGGGLLLGTLFMGRLGGRLGELRLMVMSISGLGLSYWLLANSPWLPVAGAWFLAMGFAATLVNVSYGTFLQKVVSDEMRGRVFSIDIAIGNSVGLLALGVTGVMADHWGAVPVISAGGLCLLLLGLVALRLGVFRRSEALVATPPAKGLPLANGE